jgi:hypothetical protein
MRKAAVCALLIICLLALPAAVRADMVNPGVYNSWTVPFFLLALGMTLAIELLAAFACVKLMKIKCARNALLAVIMGNLLSLPVVWFQLSSLPIFLPNGLSWVSIAVSEAFAVAFEGVRIRDAFIVSLAINMASFVIGGLVFGMMLGSLSGNILQGFNIWSGNWYDLIREMFYNLPYHRIPLYK